MKGSTVTGDRGALVRMKNSPYFYADFVDADGVRHRQSTKERDEAKAMKVLGRLLGEVDAQTYRPPAAQRLTVGQLLDAVVPDLEARGKRSGARAARAIAAVRRSTLAARRVTRVTTSTLTQYVLERRATGVADATIKYELAMVRRAFVLARRDRRVTTVPEIPALALNNARQVLVDRGAFERMRAAIAQQPRDGEMLYDLLTVGYYLGWRLQEVLPLEWAQVDFTRGLVSLLVGTDASLTEHTVKNDEGRIAPMEDPELANALRRRKAYTEAIEIATGRPVAHVFHRAGRPIKDIRGAWEAALERAGFAKACDARGRQWNAYRWHDFRRTTATNLIRAGVDEQTAMKQTGHKTREVFRRYRIIHAEDLVAAARQRAAYEGRLSAELTSNAGQQ